MNVVALILLEKQFQKSPLINSLLYLNLFHPKKITPFIDLHFTSFHFISLLFTSFHFIPFITSPSSSSPHPEELSAKETQSAH